MPLNTGDGVAALSSLGMNCKALMPFLMSTLRMCSGVCAGGNCQKWPHHVESARRCSCAGEVSVTAWAHSPTPTCAPAHRFYRTEENYRIHHTLAAPGHALHCMAWGVLDGIVVCGLVSRSLDPPDSVLRYSPSSSSHLLIFVHIAMHCGDLRAARNVM